MLTPELCIELQEAGFEPPKVSPSGRYFYFPRSTDETYRLTSFPPASEYVPSGGIYVPTMTDLLAAMPTGWGVRSFDPLSDTEEGFKSYYASDTSNYPTSELYQTPEEALSNAFLTWKNSQKA